MAAPSSTIRGTGERNARVRQGVVALAILAVAGCEGGLDPDLRGRGGGFDTTAAVQTRLAQRPEPDARGIISYPGYQVAVARRGDTLADVAGRIGVPTTELASFNGVEADVPLRQGEIVALPARVTEPGGVDVVTLAGAAIDRADPGTGVTPAATPTGDQPVRHRVERGETVYTIARLYDVSVPALAAWNGLGPELDVREGQYLLIPVAEPVPPGGGPRVASLDPVPMAPTPVAQPVPEPASEQVAAAAPPSQPEPSVRTTAPGEGTPTPRPPSASEPPPEDTAATPGPAEETPPSPALGDEATEASDTARLAMPVSGPILRPYRKGTNDGIGIAADPGTPVRAADAGTVAAITRDVDQVPIVVIRHEGNLLTVYAGVSELTVEKGDTVARGQTIAQIRDTDPSFLHFEVREGFDSVDPADFLN